MAESMRQEAVRALPKGRLLLETDSPSLASRGPRARNEPCLIREAALAMADLKGLSLEEVASTTTANAERLFKDLALQDRLYRIYLLASVMVYIE